MGATETDPLWPRVAERVRSARGWSLRPVAQLGRARAARRTWLAEAAGADGSRAVVVKASANPFAASRAAWVAGALSLLGERGAPAPATGRGLREFLEPARGHHLPSGDLVHGDLNLTNVLAADGLITGVADWDDLGVGCRALDLAGLLFDWQRLRLAGEAGLAPDGADRLVRRIVEITGEPGLRLVLAYGAVARLGLAAQRNQPDALATWRHTTDALLDTLR